MNRKKQCRLCRSFASVVVSIWFMCPCAQRLQNWCDWEAAALVSRTEELPRHCQRHTDTMKIITELYHFCCCLLSTAAPVSAANELKIHIHSHYIVLYKSLFLFSLFFNKLNGKCDLKHIKTSLSKIKRGRIYKSKNGKSISAKWINLSAAAIAG